MWTRAIDWRTRSPRMDRRGFLAGVAAVLLWRHGRVGQSFIHRTGWVLHRTDF